MTLKTMIPAGLRKRLVVARDAWRRLSHRSSVVASYLALHDGRSLNVFVRGDRSTHALELVSSTGEVVRGPVYGTAYEGGTAWTIDLVPDDLASGRYEVFLTEDGGKRAPLDPSRTPLIPRRDSMRDGVSSFAMTVAARIDASVGHAFILVEERIARPAVVAVNRRGHGIYDVTLESVDPAASVVAVERSSRAEHVVRKGGGLAWEWDIAALPVSGDGDLVWDLYVDQGGSRSRLKIASPDIREPFGVMSIPGYVTMHDGHNVRFKPYVTEDGSLTVRVSLEPAGAEA